MEPSRQPGGFFATINRFAERSPFIRFLEYAGRFTVFFAVVFWLWDIPARRRDRIRSAWSIVYHGYANYGFNNFVNLSVYRTTVPR